MLDGYATILEMDLDRVNNERAQLIALQQVPERQDRCRIRDPFAEEVGTRKPHFHRDLDQRILNHWIVT